MLVKKSEDIKSSEITDKSLYLTRRSFMRGAALAASTAGTAWLYRHFTAQSEEAKAGEKIADVQSAPGAGQMANESLTPYEDITHYNNFYEFSTEKGGVAAKAKNFITRPWTVEVGGLVHNPKTFDLDDLVKISPPEERIYRHRCVERWSMVIPWVGFPLSKLLDQARPTSQAKYVAFETLADPKQMPNVRTDVLDWPYVEGLRLDEALHPLTILASGLYGETLPPQNGAPLRLVVPWKYGFKGIKSIVKIRLVENEPPTTWNIAASREYGFYSNVNPNVSHPRWSQAQERRIGEFGVRDTLMFNGYADQVAQLYSGMDLRKYF
ncbi:MAG TPA: protein-methionine-sulfoxide reductase catalytic subunit MsrP [Blastocatellia bacterium]|jgi:sulfoxide reductase catalytic subunit YedY|nr:protein-methionine-sulfoxide reductase catalytic subunit MsrP [Blastocatellia bacterium]